MKFFTAACVTLAAVAFPGSAASPLAADADVLISVEDMSAMMQGALTDGPATNLGSAVLDDDAGDDETDDTVESDGSEYVDETPDEDDDVEGGDISLPATGLLQTNAGVGTYDKNGVYCPPGQKPDSQLMGMLQNSAMMGVQQKQQEQMQLQLMRMKMKGIMQANREIKSRMRHMRRHVPGNCDCCQACTG